MTHPNEDDLLQYVLQTLGESDHEGISEHLLQCAECRVLEREMQIEVERLGSVRIRVDLPKSQVFRDLPAYPLDGGDGPLAWLQDFCWGS